MHAAVSQTRQLAVCVRLRMCKSVYVIEKERDRERETECDKGREKECVYVSEGESVRYWQGGKQKRILF
jgi:hypothetical protein